MHIPTWFHFIQNARQRAATRRAEERAHQLALVGAVAATLESMFEATASSTAGLIEVAKANQAQASAFADWLQLFTQQTQPQSSVVSEDDEFKQDLVELRQAIGLPADLDPSDLPPEFQLAHQLQRGLMESARRD